MHKQKSTIAIFAAMFITLIPLQSFAQTEVIDNYNRNEIVTYPFNKIFTITAYYSPIEGQEHYVTGSLEKDKRLNGNGTNGADGTPVFPGMIAAPKTIPFGTKMSIPGIGLVSVHDRGGAIVPAGQRGEAHDRLDIWMGYGDDGLKRALAWGKRNVEVTVYGIRNDMTPSVNFTSVNKNYTIPLYSETKMFPTDIGYGENSEYVLFLQENLKKIGYGDIQNTGTFDEKTVISIIDFQIKNGIIDNESSFGAGYFGPQTRKAMEKTISAIGSNKIIPVAKADSQNSISQKIQLAGNGLSFLEIDLQRGSTGQAVIELQTELKKMHLLGVEPTGFYGEITENAVFKFQQSQGLVGDKSSPGAGKVGTLTRNKFREILENRVSTRHIIAQKKQGIEIVATK